MNAVNKLERFVEYRATVLDHTGHGTYLRISEDDIQEAIIFTHAFVPSRAKNIIVMIKKLPEDYPPNSQIKRPLATVCSFA